MGNGLSPLQPGETDTIILSGLGGDTIIYILKNSPDVTNAAKQFIISPQSKVFFVRKYIHQIDFKIINEIFLKEGKVYYNIINSLAGQEPPYTEKEYFLGKINMEKKEPVFVEYIKNKKNHLQSLLEKVKNEAAKVRLQKEMEMYEDM